ncbi:hypothetical protein [Thermoflexus sp.]|uniref:hypothetical protein n=1 Tax=Thermoflexus sp. TaxID=1969742 RepID=UPI002ADE5B12|nr:hypothetical protein [Thermoflexus sp.]
MGRILGGPDSPAEDYVLKVGLYRRAPPGGRIPVEGLGADGVILPIPIEIRR